QRVLTGSRSVPRLAELIPVLGKVSELWLNPEHPLRQETVHALQISTGLCRRQIESAIANCFEELTESKITSLRTVRGSESQCVFHVLPANVFTAWVHGAVKTLLAGHRCLLKPSHRESVFAQAWKRSLAEVELALAEHVGIVAWDEKLLNQCFAV